MPSKYEFKTPSERIADKIDAFLRRYSVPKDDPRNELERRSRVIDPKVVRKDASPPVCPRQKKYVPVPSDPFVRYPSAFTHPDKPFMPRLTMKSNEIEAWLKSSRHYNRPRARVVLRKSAEPDPEPKMEVEEESTNGVAERVEEVGDEYSSDEVQSTSVV